MLRRALYSMVLLILLQSSLALSQTQEATKAQLIRYLIKLLHSESFATQMAAESARNIFQVLRTARPDIPDRALQIVERELVAIISENLATPGGYFDQIVPIYDRHFSTEDIKAMVTFYSTSAGQKWIQALPSVNQENIVVSQQWANSLGPIIERRVTSALAREGLLPKQ